MKGGRRSSGVEFEASPELRLKAVPHDRLVSALAERLKRDFAEVRPPRYALFVKTSTTNFEPPKSSDWWYVRAASILRKLAIKGCMGVGGLSHEYGGRRRRGRRRERSVPASGGHIRRILAQLEAAKLVERKACGRVLSRAGWDLVLGVAGELFEEVSMEVPRLRLYVG